MFILKALLRDDVLDDTARELYREGQIDMEQAIALTVAASLHQIARYGIDIGYNEHSEKSFPITVMAYNDDGTPTEPVKVNIVKNEEL